MPRWKALPDELDPQIKEFTEQLRRLVDRSGLSIAALADRTGYSKTSWERYLGGRLLAPKGAIVALAEVTGTHPVHLTTLWELAERAWSRSEMRHDMTMEAIRISQARAALGDLAGAEGGDGGGRAGRKGGSATATPVAGPSGVSPTVPPGAGPAASSSVPPGAGPASSSSVPPQPGASDADVRDRESRNSWGVAGYRGPSPASGRPGAGTPAAPLTDRGAGRPAVASPQGPPPPASGAGKRRLTMFLAGLVGVLVMAAAVFFFTERGDGAKNEGGKASPSPTATAPVNLPPGVKCSGASCTGKDAEAMGCSGNLVTTARTVTVGTTVVEVRYSKTCGAAWGRITGATQGDSVRISAGAAQQNGSITATGDTIAYTPMVAVKNAAEATACATLTSGRTGCTR
ncbi:DUF2690 domain-containing protein [Streptomyces sp. NPDC127063]|uniref:helix-turn-helix domain-containing protein n=1 Tax=Streptomyces sp. NPDC127063 TaxID=3347123 RepID=UPI0036464D79